MTYRTPAKQAEADSDRGSVAKVDADWAWRFFLIILSSLLATIVVILVQDVKQGRRCERYGVCAFGKPAWVEGKCVCIATAHMKE